MGLTQARTLGMLALSAASTLDVEAQPLSPLEQTLDFFAAHIHSELTLDIALIRPSPIGRDAVRQVVSTLPLEGPLAPTEKEARKLAALGPILQFHERRNVFELKIIDVPQAVTGLHARAVLLISRPALNLLTVSELQAVVAHEVGHDFFWEEYVDLRERPDVHGRGP